MEQTFNIGGMSCGGCVASVERALRALPGIQTVQVDLAAASAKVAFDAAQTDVSEIKTAIEEAGYDVLA
jgi:copper ion binding protein